MDSNFLNSFPETTQLDWMNMMIQMETFTDFSDQLPPSTEFPAVPSPEFNCSPTTPTSPMLDGPQPAVPLVGATARDPLNIAPMFSDPTVNIDAAGPVLLGDPSSLGLGHRPGSVAAMREMIFRVAAMQPIHIDPESVKRPKRRNVKISKDPQSVAARLRRERISEKIRILQRLVPGGTKMDTASMLDEAVHYVKFLKTQVQSLELAAASRSMGTAAAAVPSSAIGFSSSGPNYPSIIGLMPHQLPDQGLILKSNYMNWNHIC